MPTVHTVLHLVLADMYVPHVVQRGAHVLIAAANADGVVEFTGLARLAVVHVVSVQPLLALHLSRCLAHS